MTVDRLLDLAAVWVALPALGALAWAFVARVAVHTRHLTALELALRREDEAARDLALEPQDDLLK